MIHFSIMLERRLSALRRHFVGLNSWHSDAALQGEVRMG